MLQVGIEQPQFRLVAQMRGDLAAHRDPEKMDRPGECLPHDRRFAIALGSTPFNPEHREWLPKTHFVMLMREEKLAQLRTRFDGESCVLSPGVAACADDRSGGVQAGRRILHEFPRMGRCASSRRQGTPLPMRPASRMRRLINTSR
jgi:hypothetical protein